MDFRGSRWTWQNHAGSTRSGLWLPSFVIVMRSRGDLRGLNCTPHLGEDLRLHLTGRDCEVMFSICTG